MRLVIPLVCLGIILGLTGCLPTSQNPLSSEESAEPDSRLPGVWYGKSGEDIVFLHFVGSGAKMDIVEVDHQNSGDAHTNAYSMFPSVINGVRYMNLQEKKGDKKEYYLARYHIAADGSLTIWLMSEKPVVKAIAAGKLSGKVSQMKSTTAVDSRDVSITASTEHIAKFVSNADPDLLFAEKFGTFKKLVLPKLEATPAPSPGGGPAKAQKHESKKKKSGG